MAEADSQEETSVEIALEETALDDIDETWEELGYTSRGEFLRHVVLDAIANPEFDRGDLRVMLTGEVEIQNGNIHTSEEITAKLDLDRPDVESNDWDWAMTETAREDLQRRDEYASERIVGKLDEIISGEWRNPTEDLDALSEAPHDKLLIGPFRLGCRVDHDNNMLYVLRIRMRGA